jgi:hypothetical protein
MDLDQLKKKRTVIKTRLTKTCREVENSMNLALDFARLRDLQRRLDAAREDLESVQEQILLLADEGSYAAESQGIDSYIDAYSKSTATIAHAAQDLTAHRGPDPALARSADRDGRDERSRLPLLTLPKFGGEVGKWPSWINNFRSQVDSRSNLSPADKMSFLTGSMTGRAADSVEPFHNNPDLYSECLAALESEFGDLQYVLYDSLAQLDELPDCSKNPSPENLRKLYNGLKAVGASFERLGLDLASRSSTHLPEILKKLTPEISRAYQEKLQSSQEGTFDCFLAFLKAKIQAIEMDSLIRRGTKVNKNEAKQNGGSGAQSTLNSFATNVSGGGKSFAAAAAGASSGAAGGGSSGASGSASNSASNGGGRQQGQQQPRGQQQGQGGGWQQQGRGRQQGQGGGWQQRGTQNSNANGEQQGSRSRKDDPCVKCGSIHALHVCESFKQLSPKERFNFVREKKLCAVCFRANSHLAYQCKSNVGRCRKCTSPHSSLLHFGD